MKETESLIERANKYLKSAALLLDAGDYESSVSRSYYAMFYAAQAALLTKSLSFSSHKGVIAAFGEHFIKTDVFPMEMGRELNRMHGKRQLSDYEYTFVIERDDAEQALESGKKFVEKIAQHLKI